MNRVLLAGAIAALTASAACAADNPALTIYRADGDALFQNSGSPVDEGYAVVHETRSVKLGGRSTVVVDGLPATLDAEAVAVDLGASARILAQRVLSSSEGHALAAHRGETVEIAMRNGGTLKGTLLGIDGDSLIVRSAADSGIAYVREYDRLTFAPGSGLPGSSLQLVVDGGSGATNASLTYPTSGIGWRAAYSALLIGNDNACRLRLDALASIANRSGRDFPASTLKLIAGSPNLPQHGGPRTMAMKAGVQLNAPMELPEQAGLGDYRSYTIDGTLDLPDASVTQVPLYASRDLDCERHWVSEYGGAWYGQKPNLSPSVVNPMTGAVSSELGFTSGENLPAGNLRVSMRDRDQRTELLGEARIADTPKGQPVNVTLGTAFDLSARRERTSFNIDRAARTMHEGWKVTLTNTGDVARTITVREHPGRWREWTLESSSHKPTRKTPDMLQFDVAVPANGKAVIDYVVGYTWSAKDE